MNSFFQDLRHGIRSLAKSRGFLIVAVFTLTLGIGANTAIFSVLYGVLLRPLPLRDADRMYAVALDDRGELSNDSFTFPQFRFLQDHNRWCDAIAAYTPVGFNLASGQQAARVAALHVTADYFKVLNVQPFLGRNFLSEEDQGNGSLVVILNHSLWKQNFGGDPAIIGKTIHLDGDAYTVIGVMPPRFAGGMPAGDFSKDQIDLWTPMAPVARTIGSGDNLGVIARLPAGVTLRQAHAQLDALNDAFRTEQLTPEGRTQNLSLYSLKQRFGADVSTYLWVLLGAVSFVLLIACANVANLLLARGASRAREVAIRAALGASRARLIKQFLTESLLLSLIGAAGGLWLARAGLSALLALAPVQLPRADEVKVDGWAFAFAAGVSLLTGVLFGIVPAFQAANTDVNTMLKEGSGRIGGVRGGRTRRILVVSEVALSLVLLVGATLLGETFLNLMRVDPGFDPHGILSAQIWITGSRYHSATALTTFYSGLIERLKQLPGVENVTIVGAGQPLERGGNIPINLNGQLLTTEYRIVTPEYFRTLRVALLRGRDFASTDTESSAPVAIVNQAFVRANLASGEPLGATLSGNNLSAPHIIVGVVADIRSHLDRAESPAVFLPAAQASFGVTLAFDHWFPTHVLVRTSGATPLSVNALEHEIHAADPDIPVGKVVTMDDVMAHALALQRFMMILVGLFAGLALVLAAVGIYGVISYAVAQRTKEMGLRIALGAETGSVLRLVMGDGLRLALIGAAIGVAGSYAMQKVLAGLLFGVSATDPAALAGATAVLLFVALAACFVPARRATSVDPVTALRHD